MKTIPKPKNQWIMRALKSKIIKEIVRQGQTPECYLNTYNTNTYIQSV